MSTPHSPTPPCDCDSCHRATLAADASRAELAQKLASAGYVPPTDAAVEMFAMRKTAAVLRETGVDDPEYAREVHACWLRIGIMRQYRKATEKRQVYDALGLGDPE